MSTFHRGFHGDLNETLFVGNVDEKAKTLVRVTHECLEKAINIGWLDNHFNRQYVSVVTLSIRSKCLNDMELILKLEIVMWNI